MSEVKRHLVTAGSECSEMVYASDYDSSMKEADCQAELLRLAAEKYRDEREHWHQLCAEAQVQRDQYQDQRDAALKQVEGLRALMAEAVPALQHISDTAQDLESFTLAERFRAALQAKP